MPTIKRWNGTLQDWEYVETAGMDIASAVRIKQNVTVLQTGWVDDTATSGYWLYVINDTDITADSVVDVNFHLESLDNADSVLTVVQSGAGTLTLYAEGVPTVNLIADLRITNQIGGV